MPARLRDIKRAAEKLGVVVELPKKGSHYRFFYGGKMYPIAAHNGLKEEISDLYIRWLCEALGLDEKRLRAKL